MQRHTHEAGHHGLTATDIAHLIATTDLPFDRHADATGFFFRTLDRSLQARDHANIAALATSLDFGLEDLEAAFDYASGWSADYFDSLARSARSTGSSAWISEKTFLYLLALIAVKSDDVTVERLTSLGWAEDTAARTIAAARRFCETRH